MVMKNYPSEFKAEAVALYRSRPDASIDAVAADLGVSPETLRSWIRAAGASRPAGRRPAKPAAAAPDDSVSAELAAARKRIAELEEERDILRRAAKYFAGEMSW